MTGPNDERPGRGHAPDAAEFARQERKLEQFRANIERLRRERQAALDEFGALTRRKEERVPASSLASSPPEDLVAPQEPDVLTRNDGSILSALPTGDLDRFAPPEPGPASGSGDAVDLPDGEPPAAPLPDDPLDFAGLTEEDTIIDSAPRRAADRRRTVILSLIGAGAVGILAWLLWGPWSHRRPETAPPAFAPAGESVPAPGSEAPLSQQPIPVQPEPPAATPQRNAVAGAVATPGAAPVRPLVVQLVTTRPVWMRAVVDGRPSWNRLVPAGETLTLEADASVTLRIGDAGAVRVSVNGRDRGPAGRDGQVVTASYGVADQ